MTEAKPHGGVATYVVIWGCLMLLTLLTYALSRVPLGAFHVPVALTIAAAKSGLVIAFFMHLKDQAAINRAYLVLAGALVALLISFTLIDAMTRFSPARPTGALTGGSQAGPQERELPRQ